MDWLVDLFLITLGLVEFILRVAAFTVICALMFPAFLLADDGVEGLTGILKPELWKIAKSRTGGRNA